MAVHLSAKLYSMGKPRALKLFWRTSENRLVVRRGGMRGGQEWKSRCELREEQRQEQGVMRDLHNIIRRSCE